MPRGIGSSKTKYHFDPYSGATWQHDPSLYVNSLGFGYCDDVASAFATLMTSYGLDARVWAINGHVVSEVYNDGRWQIYDVDLQALYIDTEGNIAGYDYIVGSSDDFAANLQNSIYASDVDADFFAYHEFVIDLYQTTENNSDASYYYIESHPDFGGESVLTLPAGINQYSSDR